MSTSQERRAVLWSFLYFFTLLAGSYVLRPVRDEMGIAGGIEKLPLMFTATFVASVLAVALFSWVVTKLERRRIIPVVYHFAALNLLGFWLALRAGVPHPIIARVYFVWVSVYNVFVVSVFWSFMADVWTHEQARRVYGLVAAGGTAGGLAGSTVTTALAPWIGPGNMLLVSLLLLEASVVCVRRLVVWSRAAGQAPLASQADARIGGDLLGGLRRLTRSRWLLAIAGLTICTTTTATFLYLEQARVVKANVADPGLRTSLFSGMDAAVNALVLVSQVFLTSRLLRIAGVAITLAAVVVVSAVGFGVLAVAPALGVVVVFQIVRRAAHYAFERPARELVFTRTDEEEKYKAKNLVDTFIYRGGDAASGWGYAGLYALGASSFAVSLSMLPMCAAWLILCLVVARGFAKRGEPA